jgi:hypothetical protein
MEEAMENHFNQHYSAQPKTKRLVQNYFYYMMEFERYIHQICGKDSFIPDNFVDKEHQRYL